MKEKKRLQKPKEEIILPKNFVGAIGHLCGPDAEEVSRIIDNDYHRAVAEVSRASHIPIQEAERLVSRYY